MTRTQQNAAALIVARDLSFPAPRATAQETARRWADRLAHFLEAGFLCRGCGYRVVINDWLDGPGAYNMRCPHCYTSVHYR